MSSCVRARMGGYPQPVWPCCGIRCQPRVASGFTIRHGLRQSLNHRLARILRDRDSAYGALSFGASPPRRQFPAYSSPTDLIRRECLDHVVVFGEQQRLPPESSRNSREKAIHPAPPTRSRRDANARDCQPQSARRATLRPTAGIGEQS
jgi:hypothetical protein